jgi:hypothetical protein
MEVELTRTARFTPAEAACCDTYTKSVAALKRRGIDTKLPFEGWVDRDGNVVYRQATGS